MIKNKKTPGLAVGSMTGTGPGGLGPREFAQWYRDHEIEKWYELDLGVVEKIARVLEKAEKKGSQVFVFGNGGSAATASHLATDWGKTAQRKGKKPLRCMSLNDNVPLMTAIANDLGYAEVFVRQLEGVLRRGDVVVIISGSGNSPSVVKAAQFAKKKGALVIGMTGFSGGKLRRLASLCLHIDTDQYGVIEDLHMAAGSMLAFYLKQRK
ncbi:MAG: SIS domain-containing protein [Elusimicrobiota bacterium]